MSKPVKAVKQALHDMIITMIITIISSTAINHPRQPTIHGNQPSTAASNYPRQPTIHGSEQPFTAASNHPR
jgi:hypothetical protein